MKKLIIVSGPSGSGKSTLLKRLFEEFPDSFLFSVSDTTRKPRVNERDGFHYNFISVDKFDRKVKDNEFVEWTEFSGNKYGTSKSAIEAILKKNKNCVLDIDMEGVKSLKKLAFESIFIFIKPPSLEELEVRLKNRGFNSEAELKKRLEIAKVEMKYADIGVHDHIIINKCLDKAYSDLKKCLLSHNIGII